MATYFVNLSAGTNGSGTEVSPYNALASLPTLSAGDVVEVQPGSSQTMSAAYTVSGTGTLGNPITIRANPAMSGAKPQLRIVSEGQVGIIVTGRSYVRLENLNIVGASSWTSQNTVGVRLNGGLTGIVLEGVDCQYCRFDLVGGFATNGITLNNCQALDNATDGVRLFSGTGTYVWQNITIRGGTYNRNGTAAGANGAGISVYVQNGHTGTTIQNLTIEGVTVENNYRSGIVTNDDSVAWATVIGAANTTPPTRQIKGLRIYNNRSRRNGGAGIGVQAAQPSTSMPVEVSRNVCEDNSTRTTLGNIWTGGCLNPVIEWNTCLRANSNGTVTGDGCGIFDDQWNDGAIVRFNEIEGNVFNSVLPNPNYTAYGIGIYRCANGKHYSNRISNCRHGFVIGYLSGATAPTMSGVEVFNNTLSDVDVYAFSVWSDTPSSAITFSNNLIVNAGQDIEAQSSGAGAQTYQGNVASDVGTKYTGNSVGAAAFDHTVTVDVTSADRPLPGSPLLTSGANLGYVRDIEGKQSRKHIGAYGAAMLRVR
jgi:hypothetical protein